MTLTDIAMIVIGAVISTLLYRMSRSLGNMETSMGYVVKEIDDHETRIRTLEKP